MSRSHSKCWKHQHNMWGSSLTVRQEKQRQQKNQTLEKVLPLILWWQLLHSASLYRISFTHSVSSHPKLKCPYQLVTGVPPASSQLHRRDVREKSEKLLTQSSTPPQTRRCFCESVGNFSPDINESVNKNHALVMSFNVCLICKFPHRNHLLYKDGY